MGLAVQFALPLDRVGVLPPPVPAIRRQVARLEKEIKAVYTDGGVCGKSPSAIGGTWAYCMVNSSGQRVIERSGVLRVDTETPELCKITNNHTELWAVLMALEALPEAWEGTLYTDSEVTVCRLQNPLARMFNIPREWQVRLRDAQSRVGRVRLRLLGGHPNKAELRTGVRKDGKLVSEHNVWCDKACWNEKAHLKGKD